MNINFFVGGLGAFGKTIFVEKVRLKKFSECNYHVPIFHRDTRNLSRVAKSPSHPGRGAVPQNRTGS